MAPHHFTLTDEALDGPVRYDTNLKMNPPLRAVADRDAMLEGIADGTVDVIATDHAPHHADEKMVEFDRAPFGIVGLETAVPMVFDRLVHTGRISLVADDRAAVDEPGAGDGRAGRRAPAKARPRTSPFSRRTRRVTIDAVDAEVEVQEHTVRPVGAEGRRRRDHRRRQDRLPGRRRMRPQAHPLSGGRIPDSTRGIRA